MSIIWEILLLLFGVAELWTFFIEPSIEKREEASAKKRREREERRIREDYEAWDKDAEIIDIYPKRIGLK